MERRKEDKSWLKDHWRPMMAWQYFIVCLWDFMLAPMFFAWYAWYTKTDITVWAPLTTQGGGLYHLSMGAIVGVTSWQKSQERIRGATSYGQYGQQGYQDPQYDQYDQYSNNPYHTTMQTPQIRPTVPRRTAKVMPSGPDPEL